MASLVAELAEKLNAAGNSFTIDESTIVVDTLNNRVGIGASPTANALEVSGNVTLTGNFTSKGIDDNATGPSKAVTINSSNQVSIGKNSVYGESLDFNNLNGIRSDIATTVTSGNNIQSETALVVTGGLYNQAGTNRTSIDLHHNGKDSGNGMGWRLESRADSNSVGTDNSEFAIRKVNLVGSSGSLSTTYSDVITIDSSGNVGIGTNSFGNKLNVDGNIQLGTWATSGSRYIGFARDDNNQFGSAGSSGLEIESVTGTGNYSQNLHFWTHIFNGGSTRRMSIINNGNVGIGTDSPATTLDVNGNIDFDRTTWTNLGTASLSGISANTWYTIDEYDFNGYGPFMIRLGNYNQEPSYGYINEWIGLFIVTNTAANNFGINSNEVIMNSSGHTKNPPTMTARFNLVSASTVNLQIKISYVNSLTQTSGLDVEVRKF